jgi:hypothetical protein
MYTRYKTILICDIPQCIPGIKNTVLWYPRMCTRYAIAVEWTCTYLFRCKTILDCYHGWNSTVLWLPQMYTRYKKVLSFDNPKCIPGIDSIKQCSECVPTCSGIKQYCAAIPQCIDTMQNRHVDVAHGILKRLAWKRADKARAAKLSLMIWLPVVF